MNKLHREKTVAYWLEQEIPNLKGDGIIYCTTPTGIGCCVEEAKSVFKRHIMPVTCRTQYNEKSIGLQWPTRDGSMKTFISIYRS